MRFDKKKKKKFNVKVVATSIVAITLIGITGISIGKFSGINQLNTGVILDGVSTIQKGFNTGFTFLLSHGGDLVKFKSNANKVSSLEMKNQELEKKLIKANDKLESVESLEKLKKSLNFIDEKYQANSISTKIVGKNDGNWYSTFVIGAGSKDGVKKDSIVMNGSGLVGVVYEVSSNYSKAISLIDSTASVSFKLQKNSDAKGIITSDVDVSEKEDYKEKGYLQGYLLEASYEVLPGDVLVTSGLGIYPEGIPIGEVNKVIDNKNKSLKYVVLKPYANFKNLDDVVVIEPRELPKNIG